MVEYAGHEFRLNVRQKDGATLRDHLEIVYRQSGKMPEQLEPKELPYALDYLWMWFCELSGCRQYSEIGALPLTYQEIQAWATLTKTEPAAWEIEVIKKLDTLYITEMAKK